MSITMTTTATQFPTLLYSHHHSLSSSFSLLPRPPQLQPRKISPILSPPNNRVLTISNAFRKSSNGSKSIRQQNADKNDDGDDTKNGFLRTGLWVMEGVYILWLFLLPYAPGDPVWAISSDTINSLVGLSLNFFFILPLSNAVCGSIGNSLSTGQLVRGKAAYIWTSPDPRHRRDTPWDVVVVAVIVVGFHVLDAPVLHPMSEGLFNFVIGWTLMFAPLLYTDLKRDRYKGSLDVLWGLQMFLTNTFLIPYMAFRLNQANGESYPTKPSRLGTVMIQGAPTVGLIGGAVCLISILWALFGRMDSGFGNVSDRWNFMLSYLGSERLAYAFIWDIVLYTLFQPWLIGENLANVQEDRVDVVNYLRYIPVVGMVAYLLCLKKVVYGNYEPE